MTMTREATMALLAAGSYWDIRGYEGYDPEKRDESNHAPIPEGWKLLPEHESHSGEGSSWSGAGFSARAYQRIGTNEIAISYATTEAGQTSHFFDPPAKSSSLYKQKILAWRMNFDKNLNAATMACKTHIWKQP